MEEIYTLKEAGAILKRSRSALYLMIGRGDIEALKHGKLTVIRKSEIDRYLAELPKAKVAVAPPLKLRAGTVSYG